MRQPTKYIGLILFLLSIGCTRQTNDSLTTESSDSLTNATNDSKPTTTDSTSITKPREEKIKVELIIKDSTKYSPRFLAGLRTLGHGRKFVLTDNKIVTDDFRHNEFPETLPLNKEVVLTAKKGEIKYWLAVNRLNYTTISYNVKLTGANGEIVNEKGQAELNAGFMLGSSTGEDEEGNVYACDDYFSIEGKCIFLISIGKPDNIYKASMMGCGNYLTLEYCPTLK